MPRYDEERSFVDLDGDPATVYVEPSAWGGVRVKVASDSEAPTKNVAWAGLSIKRAKRLRKQLKKAIREVERSDG